MPETQGAQRSRRAPSGMRLPSRLPIAAALALAAALTAGAQNGAPTFKPKKSKLPDDDVDKAVEKGVAWLKTASPATFHKGTTSDELIFYTLYHGGLPKNDPVFQTYLKRIVDKDPAKTYCVAIAAMCLSELDKVGYQWKLEQYAQFLVDNQCENGQWTYGEPIRIDKKPDLSAIATTASAPPPKLGTGPSAGDVASSDGMAFKGPKKPVDDDKTPLYGTIYPKGYDPKAAAKRESRGRGTSLAAAPPVVKVKIKQRKRGGPSGDNSNSQYAALGLRACAEAGIEVEDQVIRDAVKWWENAQHGDGGWGYGGTDDGPWGSMTVGGIGALAIYDWILRKDWRADKRILKSNNEWLPKNWAVDKNPRGEEFKKAHWHYYYLYGLERAGMIYGTDFFGSHDWYDEGGAYLLKNQDGAGSWKNDVVNTCFAILFLRRATKPLVPTIETGR